MTDQEINIAIAEACGWVNCQTLDDAFVGENPKSRRAIVAWEGLAGRELKEIPDYCADLNAMHGAEKTLANRQRKEFVDVLWCVVNPDLASKWYEASLLAFFDYITATSRQRAEAFLKTLGKWIE